MSTFEYNDTCMRRDALEFVVDLVKSGEATLAGEAEMVKVAAIFYAFLKGGSDAK